MDCLLHASWLVAPPPVLPDNCIHGENLTYVRVYIYVMYNALCEYENVKGIVSKYYSPE